MLRNWPRAQPKRGMFEADFEAGSGDRAGPLPAHRSSMRAPRLVAWSSAPSDRAEPGIARALEQWREHR